jgi:hypothetical protein
MAAKQVPRPLPKLGIGSGIQLQRIGLDTPIGTKVEAI